MSQGGRKSGLTIYNQCAFGPHFDDKRSPPNEGNLIFLL